MWAYMHRTSSLIPCKLSHTCLPIPSPPCVCREAPPSSYMYFLVNAALLVSMVAAAVLEQVVR